MKPASSARISNSAQYAWHVQESASKRCILHLRFLLFGCMAHRCCSIYFVPMYGDDKTGTVVTAPMPTLVSVASLL